MTDKLFIQDGETKREFSEEEYAQYALDQAEQLKLVANEKAKVDVKAALLAKLGITADEAKLLLG